MSLVSRQGIPVKKKLSSKQFYSLLYNIIGIDIVTGYFN